MRRIFFAVFLLLAVPVIAQEPLRLDIQPPDYRFHFLPRFKAPGQRSLALALGGGGAKGIAHAGVLQRLEEEGLQPDTIAGTSIGAYMGSMYAVGYSGFSIQALMEHLDLGVILLDHQRRDLGETLWEQETRTATIFSVEVDRRDGLSFEPGASSGLALKRTLQWLLSRGLYYGGTDFDQLRVPFRAVSTDLQKGEADAPGTGSLVDVVRASMSIPGMFRPVMLNGHQHVDGLLVENLPVFEAKTMNPHGLVMGVEVGGQVDMVRSSSVFTLMLRILDVSIEERTRISRKAADVLLRPDTSKAQYLEFTKQTPALVALGRDAFNQHQEDLERGIYGADGELPMPLSPLRIEAPEPLQGPLQALIKEVIPEPGKPVLKRHYLRLLRRIHAAGLAMDSEISFPVDSSPVLRAISHPVVRNLELDAPEEWKAQLAFLLEDGQVKTGLPFNPTILGRVMDRFLMEATLRYRPTLSFQDSAFDPATGHLKVVLREPKISAVRVVAGILSKGDTTYLERLLAPLAGEPLDAQRLFERVALGEVRLNLEELVLGEVADPKGPVLVMTPVPHNHVTLDASLAFESTWGFHAGLSVQTRNIFQTGVSLGFQASTNRLQDTIDLDFSKGFHAAPRAGLRLFARHFEQHFLKESLVTPAVLVPVSGLLADRSIRERGLGFGFYQRFGERDQGLWSLDLIRRWNVLLPDFPGSPLPIYDTAQFSGEWDSFDRYTFPTEGLLVRLMGAKGQRKDSDLIPGQDRLHYAYLRGRKLWRLKDWVSLDLDGETGLGWNLPISRWYSLGGPSFILGTPSAGYLTPNFVMARVGAPLRLASLFGLSAQLEPRLDYGYLGSTSPGGLREGTRVRGIGLIFRTEVGRFFVELAVGHAAFASEGQGFRSQGTRLNLLVGMRPWDLWRRR